MLYERIEKELKELEAQSNLRQLPRLLHRGSQVEANGRQMLNLSSNDYLGLAADLSLREEFMQSLSAEQFLPTSSSSRLLTGNFTVYDELEEEVARRFGTEAALVFNCGYHANSGILPAVCTSQTLILADKLVHASLIDGIRLSTATCVRYRHNDLQQLERLLLKHQSQYEQIIIVTESVFSMDGDKADLRQLVELKKRHSNVLLYVDEAHAFGVFGPTGLGCAEECGCIRDIDFLVGTFGKAAASAGAYLVCTRLMRQWLINKMRPFIFTTALPPVNMAWTLFILRKLSSMQPLRNHLWRLGERLRSALDERGITTPSQSQIVPLLIGPSGQTMLTAEALQRHGFYLLPVRPPTVPEGTSRIRISLTAAMTDEEMEQLIAVIGTCLEKQN